MKRTTVAIRRSAEYSAGDFVTKVVYRALRGSCLTWHAPATAEDALYRACLEADLEVTLTMVHVLLARLPALGLAAREDHEDGSGQLTVPRDPPTVEARRAAQAQARAERLAQAPRTGAPPPTPVGKQGGLTSTQRSRKRTHPEEFVGVAPGRPGRPRKTVAEPAEKTVASGSATVFDPPVSAPPTGALAPATPPGPPPFRGGGPGGGEEAAEKTVAPTPPTPKTVAPDPDLAKLSAERCGAWACEVLHTARRVFNATGERAGRATFGRYLQAAGYRAEDVRVVAYFWRADPAGALARVSATEGKTLILEESLAQRFFVRERALAEGYWRPLPVAVRQAVARGERAPPPVQPPLVVGAHYGPPANAPPPASAPAATPGLTKVVESPVPAPQKAAG